MQSSHSVHTESKATSGYIFVLILFHLTITFDIVHRFHFLKIILLLQGSSNFFFLVKSQIINISKFAFHTVYVRTFLLQTKSFLTQRLYKNRWGKSSEAESGRRVRFDSQAVVLLTPVLQGSTSYIRNFPSTFLLISLQSLRLLFLFYYVSHCDQLSSLQL